MTKEQILNLAAHGRFLGNKEKAELVETHISWVLLGDEYAFKIKKELKYSFIDFSTVEIRHYYCLRELELNRRLSGDMYIAVVPVKSSKGSFFIGEGEGELLDYAVQMKKLDRAKQMNILLSQGQVTISDISNLAQKIAEFHKRARIIHDKDVLDISELFNDLRKQSEFLSDEKTAGLGDLIHRSISQSDRFIEAHRDRLQARLKLGYFRECHGDLHVRNIFLLPEPLPFDCIEFNEDFRSIDVLNEIAFLCMDLDACSRGDLSDFFLSTYNLSFAALINSQDRELFLYYKSYRANIRAKVNCLRARSAESQQEKDHALAQTRRYLELMAGYLNLLS